MCKCNTVSLRRVMKHAGAAIHMCFLWLSSRPSFVWQTIDNALTLLHSRRDHVDTYFGKRLRYGSLRCKRDLDPYVLPGCVLVTQMS